MRTALRDAAARGEQSLFHCAGDRCAETVLAAMESTGDVDWAAARIRIEHGDGVVEDLLPRAARLGVVVVQNPTHFTIGELLVERFGVRHRYQPLRSLLQAGVRLALGSDGPMNPFLNILLASTHPARPEEALTRKARRGRSRRVSWRTWRSCPGISSRCTRTSCRPRPAC